MINKSNQMAITSWDEEDRPREKLLTYGRKQISNVELLAVVIGSGSVKHSAIELSRKLLTHFDNSLYRLSRVTAQDLQEFNGIGPAKAAKIVASIELAMRIQSSDRDNKQIKTSRDVYSLLLPKIGDLQNEEFWILVLNNSLSILSIERISIGGISNVLVDVKLIFKKVLANYGTSIVLAHNHPSGKLYPSESDRRLTKKIFDACELLEINLADHVIITRSGYFSFADENQLPTKTTVL